MSEQDSNQYELTDDEWRDITRDCMRAVAEGRATLVQTKTSIAKLTSEAKAKVKATVSEFKKALAVQEKESMAALRKIVRAAKKAETEYTEATNGSDPPDSLQNLSFADEGYPDLGSLHMDQDLLEEALDSLEEVMGGPLDAIDAWVDVAKDQADELATNPG
jgi:hypothetical protein